MIQVSGKAGKLVRSEREENEMHQSGMGFSYENFVEGGYYVSTKSPKKSWPFSILVIDVDFFGGQGKEYSLVM